MSVAVIADAHLGGPGGSPAPLLRQMSQIREQDCRHLVLLGDLFQVWIGYSRYETSEVRATLEVLRGLRNAGIRVDYVEGNRDFFIADGPYAEIFDHVGQEAVFKTAGRRYLAVHGDGLNHRDYLYRFWNRTSKSRLSRLGMRHLPRGLAHHLVGVTERRLAKTNFKHKTSIPEAVIRAYAAHRLGEGFDVLLLGHYHEKKRWSVGKGEVRVLEAWFRSRRIEWFGRED